jgi:hypothetical protein
MRVFTAMQRWLSPGIFALVLLLTLFTAAVPVSADTGTYRITDYVVTLEPQSSGEVRITCEQKWLVTGGNIPWITVGLPNSHFSVENYGEAAAKAYADNSGSWTGVRIDLDKTYLANETFSIKFTVLQNNILERLTDEKKWRIDYTPGWYDRAKIDHLQINLVSPVAVETYSLVDPLSTTSGDNTITWEKTNISPGGKFNIRVECLDGGFLTATAGVKKGISTTTIAVIVVIAILVIGLILLAIRKNREAREAAIQKRIADTERELAENKKKQEEADKGFREYVIKEGIEPDEEGRYYDKGYGNYITPAIWTAVILYQQQQRQQAASRAYTTHSNCACACVSCACACACACAGGGAAGCAKKTLHACRNCSQFKAAVKTGENG